MVKNVAFYARLGGNDKLSSTLKYIQRTYTIA